MCCDFFLFILLLFSVSHLAALAHQPYTSLTLSPSLPLPARSVHGCVTLGAPNFHAVHLPRKKRRIFRLFDWFHNVCEPMWNSGDIFGSASRHLWWFQVEQFRYAKCDGSFKLTRYHYNLFSVIECSEMKPTNYTQSLTYIHNDSAWMNGSFWNIRKSISIIKGIFV